MTLAAYLRGSAPARPNPASPARAFRDVTEARAFLAALIVEATHAAREPLPPWVRTLCKQRPNASGAGLLEAAAVQGRWVPPVVPLFFSDLPVGPGRYQRLAATRPDPERLEAALLLGMGGRLGAALEFAFEAAHRFGIRSEAAIVVHDASSEIDDLQSWVSREAAPGVGFVPYGPPSVNAWGVFGDDIMEWDRGTVTGQVMAAARAVGIGLEFAEFAVDFWSIWQTRGEGGEQMRVRTFRGVPSFQIPAPTDEPDGRSNDSLGANEDGDGPDAAEHGDPLGEEPGELAQHLRDLREALREVEAEQREQREASVERDVPIDVARNPYAPLVEATRVGVQLLGWVDDAAVLFVPVRHALEAKPLR